MDCKYVYAGKSSPSLARFLPIKNMEQGFINKPYGGLWTSTYDQLSGLTDWQKWCKSSDYEINRYLKESSQYLLIPSSSLDIVVIDSYNDLDKLTFRPEIYGYSSIDYAGMSQIYDAIALTSQGYFDLMTHRVIEFSSWNIPCTLWLKYKFKSVIKL